MEVSYQSPFLVVSTASETLQFVTDLKELFGMGYVKEMSAAVWEAFEAAIKYYKEHCILRQLASSINATESRMMDCQKPMIAKELEQLEDLLRNPKGKMKKGQQDGKAVVWDTVEKLQAFIEGLTR